MVDKGKVSFGLSALILASSLYPTDVAHGSLFNQSGEFLIPKNESKYKHDMLDAHGAQNYVMNENGLYQSVEEFLGLEGNEASVNATPVHVNGVTVAYQLCHPLADVNSNSKAGSGGFPIPKRFVEYTFFTNAENYGSTSNPSGHSLKPVLLSYNLYQPSQSEYRQSDSQVRFIGRTMNHFAKYQEQRVDKGAFGGKYDDQLPENFIGLLVRDQDTYERQLTKKYHRPSTVANSENLNSYFSDGELSKVSNKPFKWSDGLRECVYTPETIEKHKDKLGGVILKFDEQGNPHPNSYYGQYHRTHSVNFTGKLYAPFLEPTPAQKGGSSGDVTGDLKWKLKRDDPQKDSNIHVEISNMRKTGSHFRTRELYTTVKVNDEVHIDRNKRVKSHTVAERDSELTFITEYTYTNYWRIVCGMFSCWKVPDWSRQDTFKSEHTFTIAKDFKRFIETKDGVGYIKEEDFTNVEKDEILPIVSLNNVTKWEVGEHYKIESLRNQNYINNGAQDTKPDVIKVTPYYESSKIIDEYMDKQHLVTQNTLPITVDEFNYEIEVPFGNREKMETAFRPQGMFGFYHPIDSDLYLISPNDATSEKMSNNTEFNVADKGDLNSHLNDITKFGDERVNSDDLDQINRATNYRGGNTQMIPFAQSTLSGNKATFQTDVQSLSKYTGYIANYPRFNKIRTQFIKSKNSPLSLQNEVEDIKSHHMDMYGKDVEYDYLDEIMYTDHDFSDKKLQRYYLPLEVDSPIVPREEHKHYTHIYDIGLNDGGVGFNRIFEYDMYLLGIDNGNNVGFLINENGDHKTLITTEESNYKFIKEFVIKNEDLTKMAEKEGLRDNLPKLFRMRAVDRDYMGSREESKPYEPNHVND